MTFIDGIAGSQEPTLQVQAPNYFRFHGDGAHVERRARRPPVQRGGLAHGRGDRRRLQLRLDVGGGVHRRLLRRRRRRRPARVPAARHDRLLVVHPAAARSRRGRRLLLGRRRHRHAMRRSRPSSTPRATSPATSTPATCSSARRWRRALGPDIAGAYVGGFAAFPATCTRRRSRSTRPAPTPTWETLAGGATGGEAGGAVGGRGLRLLLRLLRRPAGLIQALNAVDGDLSDGHAALREALSTMTLEAPYGTVTLDENRQGIIDTFVAAARPRRGDRRGRPADRGHHPAGRPDLRRHVRPGHAAAVARIPAVRGSATCRGWATPSRSSTVSRRPRARPKAAHRPEAHRRAPSRPAPSRRHRRPPKQHEHGDDDARVRRAAALRAAARRRRRLRWSARPGRHRRRRRPGRAPRRARSQRRRQDHAVQRHRRDLHPTGGHRHDQRRRLHDGAVTAPTGPRRRPHLPEDPAVPRPHRRGQPPAGVDRQARQPPLAQPRAGCGGAGRRAPRGRRRRRSGSAITSTPWSATCRTASSASSRSAWSWSPSRS